MERGTQVRGRLRQQIYVLSVRRCSQGHSRNKCGLPTIMEIPMIALEYPAPPGFRWVFVRCFRHYISKKLVYRKNGGYFRFLARI